MWFSRKNDRLSDSPDCYPGRQTHPGTDATLPSWLWRPASFTAQGSLYFPMYRTWHDLYSRRIETSDRLCSSERYVCPYGRGENRQRLCRPQSFSQRTDCRLRSGYPEFRWYKERINDGRVRYRIQ